MGKRLHILGLLFPLWCYSFAQVTRLSRMTHIKQTRSQNSQVIWYHFLGLRYVRHTLLLTKVLHLLLWHSARGPVGTWMRVSKESRKKLLLSWLSALTRGSCLSAGLRSSIHINKVTGLNPSSLHNPSSPSRAGSMITTRLSEEKPSPNDTQ